MVILGPNLEASNFLTLGTVLSPVSRISPSNVPVCAGVQEGAALSRRCEHGIYPCVMWC